MYEKIILVTRKTRLQQLVARFNSRGQAKFYLEHAGADFADYVREDDAYARALEALHKGLDLGLRVQSIERAIVPTFLFAPTDVVVAVGQDGLVANVAKYVGAQPVVPVNPDPGRFDGVLLPFRASQARTAVSRLLDGNARVRSITLAEARLTDGQRLLAFNDLFVGARSHVSARYAIRAAAGREEHSSSGVVISTGAGSTGWLSSIFAMAAGVSSFLDSGAKVAPLQMSWEDPRLVYCVREPFASRHSQAGIVMGMIEPGTQLHLESLMPSGGVIFSDGIETDALEFNSGAIASIGAASHRTRLVVA